MHHDILDDKTTLNIFIFIFHRHLINIKNEPHYDFTGFYLIAVTAYDKPNQLEIIEDIFIECWFLYIINVYIVSISEVSTSTNTSSLSPSSSSSMNSMNILPFSSYTSSSSNTIAAIAYTYYPFTNSTTCNNTTPIAWHDYTIRQSRKINNNNNFSIENSTIEKTNQKKYQEFFPIKVKNMQGCPVHIVTFDTPPFFILHPLSNGSYHLDGIEGILLRVLSQRFNFTPVIEIPPNNTKWGVLRHLSNGEWLTTGAYDMITNRRANICIGAFSVQLDMSTLMDASEVYYQSRLVLLIPPGRPYSSFQKLFRPFDKITWITLVICFVFGFIFIISLKTSSEMKYRDLIVGFRNRYPFFNMVIIFFGGGVTKLPIYSLARNLILIWMFGSLVLRSLYQGSLYTHLQQSKIAPPLDTITKLIDHDYLIYTNPSAVGYFDGWPKIDKLLRLFNLSDRELMWEKLRNSESRFALLSTEDHVLYANVKNYSQGIYLTCKDPIRAYPICAYFPHSSYFTGPMSAEIGRYVSGGLVQTWADHFTDRRFKAAQQGRVPEKLKMQHIVGSIYLCFFFYSVAFIVFGMEMLSLHSARLRSIVDFFTY